MDAQPLTLAVDIGGTKIAAALVAPDGSVLVRGRRATPAVLGGPAVLGEALTLARELLPAGVSLRTIGIGSAGVISTQGTVTGATEAIPGWVGADLATAFADEFGVNAHVLNDVHAHGLGEARFGAGIGQAIVLVVAVGTGVGGCILVEGRLLRGRHGAAGHVGHVALPEAAGIRCSCGATGHAEGLAAGPAILTQFLEQGGRATSAAEVAQAARRPDDPQAGLAREVLDRSGFALGRVLGGLLNTIDPDVVVLGGSVADAGPEWDEAVRRGIAVDALAGVSDTPVVHATAGQDAALLGAAAFAWDQEAA